MKVNVYRTIFGARGPAPGHPRQARTSHNRLGDATFHTAEREMPRPGDVIDGRLAVERLAGAGATAEVYRVRDLATGIPYALKWMLGGGKSMRGRLVREGRILLKLDHPNLVRVSNALLVEDRPALLLEWVDGATLEDHLEKGQPALEEAERLFRGVAEAVAYAHANGVVHRDLKPANVLLERTEDGWRPKVSDFGIAREKGEDADAGAVIGTPQYMAPEQISDSARTDARADVFALGVMLYEMCTGILPLPCDDLIGRYEAAMRGDYPPVPDTVPERFATAIRGALVGDMDRRTPSVAELLLILGGAPERPVRRLRTKTASAIPAADERRPALVRRLAAALERGEDLALVARPGLGATWVARAVAAAVGADVVDLDGCGDALAEARLAAASGRHAVVDHTAGLGDQLGAVLGRWRARHPGSSVMIVGRAVDGLRAVPLDPMLPDEDPHGHPLATRIAAGPLGPGAPLVAAWRTLDDDLAEAVAALAVFPAGFDAAGARAVAGVDPPQLLADGDRFRIPPSLRALAWSLLEEDAASDLQERHARWMLGRPVDPDGAPDAAAAIRWLAARDPVVAAALALWWAVPLGLTTSIPLGLALLDELDTSRFGPLPASQRAEVALARWELWDLRGHRQRARDAVAGFAADALPSWLGARIALREAMSLGDPQATLACLEELGPGIESRARSEEPLFRLARGAAHHALGFDAEADLTAALDATTEDRLRIEIAGALGDCHLRMGRIEDGFARWTEVLGLAREHGWSTLEVRCQRQLGAAASLGRRFDEASRRFEVALRLAVRLGDDESTADLMASRVERLLDLGYEDDARVTAGSMLQIAEQIGDVSATARAELLLAGLDEKAARGRHAEARARRAVEITRNAPAWHAASLAVLASLLADRDELGEAEYLLSDITDHLPRAEVNRRLAEAHVDLALGRTGDDGAALRALAQLAELQSLVTPDIAHRVADLALRARGTSSRRRRGVADRPAGG